MRPILKLFLAVVLGCIAMPAVAAHTQVRLVLAADVARPGDTVLAGVQLRMDPQWHTYWQNSGASGIPTSIKWDLPAGITAGEIQWPVPEKMPPDDLTTYVYENEVVLLVPLKLAADLMPGPRELKARVSWLECKEQCVPGNADIAATITVGAVKKSSPDAALIQAWQAKLPQPGTNLSAHAWWEPVKEDARPLVLEWNSATDASGADFYPQASELFEVQGGTERLPAEAGKIRLHKLVKKFQGGWPERISGVLIQRAGGKQSAYDINLPIASSAVNAAGPAAATDSAGASPSSGQPLWLNLLKAFIGGLILNAMPCVLPVIALKILSFVSEARSDPRHVRKLGLVYALGVLVSFLVLAGMVLAVKAAGHLAGWGMQFSNPQFVVLLTVLVTLVALNLFGVFEVSLGGRVMGSAGNLAAKRGVSGAFFNGVLATVLATPCTAPFLGAALGFAFAQSAPIIALVFLTVGLGLAAPYVVLSWQPAWLKFLPKPGAWMERFKIAMGFPMLATAIWLSSLVPSFYGKRSWWLGVFLLVVALAAWIYGEFVQRGRDRRSLAVVIILVLLGAGFVCVLEGQLQWRQPIQEVSAGGPVRNNPGDIDWQPWTSAAVARAQTEGRPVLVDFTADWCLTCQANKKFAIEIPSVRAKLKAINAVALLADYTRTPDDITAELTRHGRAGVPLMLVYPGKTGAAPAVLPEVLTPGMVLDALDRAEK